MDEEIGSVENNSTHAQPTPAQAQEVLLANAYIAPFAAAVAAELGEFGLRDDKINDVMLRAAKRFGGMQGADVGDPEPEFYEHGNTSVLSQLNAAFTYAFECVAPFVANAVVRLAPHVLTALEQAIIDQMNGARGTKRRRRSAART